jgi:hypothetical protein
MGSLLGFAVVITDARELASKAKVRSFSEAEKF